MLHLTLNIGRPDSILVPMNSTTDERVRWSSSDLRLFPDNGCRYEIIDGDLFVTRAPHWGHQRVSGNINSELRAWSLKTGLGEAVATPGIILSDADNVIPDLVWIRKERLAMLLDDSGHLTGAPDLVVEVLSADVENERRDREAKLKLYAFRGVQEYWIVDWRLQQIEVYRRQQAVLKLTVTLFNKDDLTSPLLPGFSCSTSNLFV
jgi:Uma2 family endonuclease